MPLRRKFTNFYKQIYTDFFVPLRLGGNIFTLVVLFTVTLSLISCQNKHQKKTSARQDLIIFHAGSLSVPFMELEKEFEKLYPNINVVREAAGSVTCSRKITDLKRDCDLIASADYKVIEDFLIPEYTDSAIHFATNEMVIVYQGKSKQIEIIAVQNWFEILMEEEVKYGRSDPNSDPCGYRALLCMKLAEKYYFKPGLTNNLTQKDTRYIRPKASDLIALLEIGELDYIFEYKSVAEQFGFSYIELPDSINLSNPVLNEYYNSVSVEINGKKPGEKITQRGEAMIYGIAKINNSANAQLFLDFLFSEMGKNIIEESGQKFIE